MSSPELKPVTVLRGNACAVNAVLFSGEHFLLSGNVEGICSLYDLRNRRILRDVSAHASSLLSLSNLEDGRIFMSAGKDGRNRTWDINDLTAPIATFTSGASHFCNSSSDCCRLDNNRFVTPSSNESSILVWDVRSPEPALRIDSPGSDWGNGMITALLFQTGEENAGFGTILAGCESGNVLAIDIRQPSYSAAVLHEMHAGQPVMTIDVSPSRNSIASGSADNFMAVSKVDSSSQSFTPIDSIMRIPIKQPGIGALKYRGDGRILVAGHWDGTVHVYDTKTFKRKAVLKNHRDSVYSLDFKCNTTGPSSELSEALNVNGLFASGSKDGTIAIWDVYSDKMSIVTSSKINLL